MILMCLRMSSSYPIDTPCVDREDEDFFFTRKPSLLNFPAARLTTTYYLETKKTEELHRWVNLSERGWVNYGERYRAQ